MFKVNDDYLKLPGSYLFSTIAKKVNAYAAANPDKKIIRLGIGDVTLPLVPAIIEMHNGKITEILPYESKPVDVDYGDKRIVPGFLDIHCHGAFEFDTNDANEEGLRNWTKGIVDEGVTGFLATTITQSEEVLTNAVKNVAKVVKDGYEGAEILGIHFEGPYLDMKYKGAQPEQYIVKPSVEQFKRYQEAADGLIKVIL